MLTEQEIAELLDIRRKMDALQSRYNEIMRKPGTSASGTDALPPVPTPSQAPAMRPEPLLRAQSPAPAPAHAAVPQMPTAKPAAAAPAPEPSPAAAAPEKGSLSEAIRNVLLKAGKPMSFESIFAKLETEGVPLPADKPKLVVRKMLFNKAFFVVQNSLYTLVEEAPPVEEPQAPPPVADSKPAASPPPPPQPGPVPAQNTGRGTFFKDRLQAILDH